MALEELKGRDCGTQTVRIERGPVKVFAAAVKDPRDEYNAEDAPVPPTFPFVMPFWGSMGAGGAAGLPLEDLRGPGRMILHGEQELIFHRAPRVGDVLCGTSTISDVYEKARDNGSKMEFYVLDTAWIDVDTAEPVCNSKFTLIVNQRAPK